MLFWDCLGREKITLKSVNRQQELLATAQALYEWQFSARMFFH